MPSKAKAPRAAASPRPLSAAKRKTLAIQLLLSGLAGDNETAAVTAALEVANEWLAWDTAFQERLRQKYGELSNLSPSKTKAPVDLGPTPVPIAGRGLKNYSPYGKFDPYQLIDEYGQQQLRAVLVRATQQHLREAVDIVQAHEPGTKPASRSNNTAMIDYIVAAVAGPGY
jgi:hypothetical protein